MRKALFTLIGLVVLSVVLYGMFALRDYVNENKKDCTFSASALPAFTVSPLDTINVAPQGPLVVQSRVFKAIPFTDFPSTCSLTLLDAAGNVHSLFVDGRGPHGSLCMFDIGDDVRTPSKAN